MRIFELVYIQTHIFFLILYESLVSSAQYSRLDISYSFENSIILLYVLSDRNNLGEVARNSRIGSSDESDESMSEELIYLPFSVSLCNSWYVVLLVLISISIPFSLIYS
jgi:hypothetical protein